jgi:Na+-driven multidrug efflux pump
LHSPFKKNEREVIKMIFLKIYLVLLGVSVVCTIMISLEIKNYTKRHYRQIRKGLVSEKIVGLIKTLLLTIMLFPIPMALFDLFLHKQYLELIDKTTSEDSDYERII